MTVTTFTAAANANAMPALTVAGMPTLAPAGRLGFDLRWMMALALFGGIAGALLAGALITALRPVMRIAVVQPAVPHFGTRRAPADRATRSGRLTASMQPAAASPARRISLEQRVGGHLQPLTHVTVRLAALALSPPSPDTPADPPDAPEPADGDPAQAIARLFGHDGGATAYVSAYSPADIPHKPAHGRAAHTQIPRPARDIPESDPTAPRGNVINMSTMLERPRQAQAAEQVLIANAGETLDDLMAAAGVAARDRTAIQKGLRAAGARPGRFKGGETIRLQVPSAHETPLRPIAVAIERRGGAAKVVRRDNGDYVRAAAASVQTPAASTPPRSPGAEPDIRPEDLQGLSVRDALTRLSENRIAPATLASALGRLAGHDLSLDQALTPKDSAEFVYAGDGDPDLIYAAFTLGGESRHFYRFEAPDDGSVDYYDANGRSATELLLRKPLPNGRLNDGFGWRIHPVLGDRRFHNGVDYDAPMGSPIVAAGAGVVERIDYENGYGKFVRLRHDGGYETTYAHVSGFPHGLKVGQRVRQGQIIAFTGSTGLSTGSHLYYEVRVNGRYVDPLRIKLASGRALAGDILQAFQAERRRIDSLLQASGPQNPVSPAGG